LTVEPDELASGCGGGTFTLQGLMLAGVLWIGAVGVASLAGGSAPGPQDSEAELA